jgi:redox-sensitive bicupin YhaK (pirin superfamily)
MDNKNDNNEPFSGSDNDGNNNSKDDGDGETTTKEGGDPMTASVRLIAGGMDDDYDERNQRCSSGGAAKTFSPVQMWDVTIPYHPRTYVDIPFPPNQNCIVFVRRGGIQIGATDDGNNNNDHNNNKKKKTSTLTKLGPQDVAIMHRDGIATTVRVYVDEVDTNLLIMGGQPLDEPIAAQGPFVMNTRQELQQAIADYQSGKF